MNGRAAVFHGTKDRFVIQELSTPEVEPGGLLVRVTAAGICGSDLHYWRGDNPLPVATGEPGPVVPGHEFTGVVETLGAGVTTDSLGNALKLGDRVAFPYFFPCMRCYNCMRGELHACPYRATRTAIKNYPYCHGGFADFFYLKPGHFVFKAPDELSDAALVPVNCALSQVTFALHRADLHLGDTVVVQGAGGLGLNAMAVAREMGAGQVIAIDGQEQRLHLARRCGATEVINIAQLPTVEDRVRKIGEYTNGRGADVVVEVVGFPAAVAEGLQMVRLGGVYLEIGHITPNSAMTLNVDTLVLRQIRLLGIQHYNPWVIPATLDFLVRTRDKYPLSEVQSHSFPLERINEAFDAAEWMGREGGTHITRAIVTM